MTDMTKKAGWLPGAAVIVAAAIFGWLFLLAEADWEVFTLLGVAAAAVLIGWWMKAGTPINASWRSYERQMNIGAVVALLAVIAGLAEDHFPLLMLSTMLLYFVVAIGLNIQFGLTGMVNFAGAAFFGAGAYTAAVLNGNTLIPSILILPLGGLIAGLMSVVLLVPIVRTTGHYAAVVTMAFGVLFKTFLEVNDILGGPQGLMVNSLNLFGWDFNNAPVFLGTELSFYLNYALLATLLAVLAFVLFRRIERSWLGLSMDAVRLDETAASCFGISITRIKIASFLLGNIVIGTAGALYGMMISFIAPASFTFPDSLLMVSIVLLGGMGSPWGAAIASAIVILLPEKLQILQEYRFLLFSVMVILVLLFRPQGLLPRQVRSLIPNWRSAK